MTALARVANLRNLNAARGVMTRSAHQVRGDVEPELAHFAHFIPDAVHHEDEDSSSANLTSLNG